MSDRKNDARFTGYGGGVEASPQFVRVDLNKMDIPTKPKFRPTRRDIRITLIDEWSSIEDQTLRGFLMKMTKILNGLPKGDRGKVRICCEAGEYIHFEVYYTRKETRQELASRIEKEAVESRESYNRRLEEAKNVLRAAGVFAG